MGIDYTHIKGTGPRGRITYDDIMESSKGEKVARPSQIPAAVPTSSEGYKDVDLTSIRKSNAEKLVLSKTTIPHFYVNVDCNMDKTFE